MVLGPWGLVPPPLCDQFAKIEGERQVILPPTVYGSPRFYAEIFQDNMCIVRNYGKPSFFVTFTCNPACRPEIKSSLFANDV